MERGCLATGPVPSRAAGCYGSVAGSSWPGWSRGCSSWNWAAAWRKVGVCSPSARVTPAPSSLPPAWSGEAGGWPPVPADHPLLLSPDYIRIARCFEATRQRCCRLEQDGRRAREQLARVEAERAALEVKLKHARNQVEVEMKKRHRAEAELEKQVRGLAAGVPCGAGCGDLSPLTATLFHLQERKLQLLLELLMREPCGNGALSREQCSVLSALTGRHLGAALAPVRR